MQELSSHPVTEGTSVPPCLLVPLAQKSVCGSPRAGLHGTNSPVKGITSPPGEVLRALGTFPRRLSHWFYPIPYRRCM